MAKAVMGVVGAFLGILFITIMFGSWYTVDQGERAVLLTNGAYTETAAPGLHFKMPWFQSAVKLSTRQQVIKWYFEGKGQDYRMEAYSRDQQAADLTVTVNYHVPDSEVANVYMNYGSVEAAADRLVKTKAPQQIKTIFGQFNAVTVIQERAHFNAEVTKAVQAAVDGPIIVDSVQVQDISFSPAYEQAVEARMTAEVEVQKRQQQLAQEKINAEIAVTQAKGRADSVKAEADAAAYQVKIKGEAEAEAIKARATALAQNENLVELTKAERWDGKLPTTMVPGSSVPFLNVGQAK